MQIIDDKVLLVRTRRPHLITERVQKSEVLGQDGDVYEVAVHWGLKEAAQLTDLRYKDVPSTILRDYKWPGRHKPFAHQRTTSAFLTLNNRAFCFNEAGCVDADTEYLSPSGWVKISEYTGGKVAQYDPETGSAEFVDPIEYVKLPCTDMVRIKTKYGLDQLLSPEHRVLLLSGRSAAHKQEVVSAETLLERHDAWHSGSRHKTGGHKKGTNSIAFSASTIPTTFAVKGGEGIALTEAQLRLQVAVIADGYFGSGTTHCVVRVKKLRKVLRLRELLNAANVAYQETTPEYAGAEGFHIFKFSAPLRVKIYGPEFWTASQEQLAIIADEVVHWDGSPSAGEFFTSQAASADFIQYAFSATGRTARLFTTTRTRNGVPGTDYVVRARRAKALYVEGPNPTMWEEPSTDGFKYCFQVPSTFLIFRRNGCVFASGNTGKTASVIWAADYLMNIGQVKRVLVLCPLSIMKSAWQEDLFTFAMHRSCSVAHGTSKQRAKIIAAGAEFVIINHDGLEVVKDQIIAGGFDLMVVDEANCVKSPQTKRWKVFHEVAKTIPRLWMLTGTPAAQSPLDAYGLAKLVNPGGVPSFFGRFRDMVMYKVTQFKWAPKPQAEATVHKVLQPAIRFEKKDCLDLPPVLHTEREAPLTPQQMKYYKKLAAQMVMEAADERVSAVNAAVKMTKLLQIAGGAVYSDDGAVVEFDVSNRIKVVLEAIDEASGKVLVFVPFTHTIDLLREALEAADISCGVINGSVSMNKRSQLVTDFQNKPDPHVLLIQPQAASHGLTLTAANTIIWYAPVPSVETYLQANARIDRPGQKKNMQIIHIKGSPIETKLYAMLRDNLQGHERIIDLYRQEMAESG